jgi:alkanesulfonate monooxygenase SsuD/methylene tetrahydromethanopterin reductase-like flavin-dependent oxidoreductase (luciferase family)
MIGGTGKRVLLKLVARHANMWNASAGAEVMRELVDTIARHAESIRRDPVEIEKTVMMPLCYRAPKPREDFVCGLIANMRQTTPEAARAQIMIGGKDECLATVERYRRVGVTHFIFMTFAPFFLDEMQAFAEEVMPAARRV